MAVTDAQELVDLGIGVACRMLDAMVRAKREEGEEREADVLDTAARVIRLFTYEATGNAKTKDEEAIRGTGGGSA